MLKIDTHTKISHLLRENPEALEAIVSLSPGFLERFNEYGEPQMPISDIDAEWLRFRPQFEAWAAEFWPEATARRVVVLMGEE